MTAILEKFYFLFCSLQPIELATFNRIGSVMLTVSCTSSFKMFFYLQHRSLYQSSNVSPVELTDGAGGGCGAKSFAIKKAWGSINSSLFNPLWVKTFLKMKKCTKTVHITTWLLVLLTLQHQLSKFSPFVCTNLLVLLAQLHQYIGATDIIAPICCCNCASSANRRRNANILWIFRFCRFF